MKYGTLNKIWSQMSLFFCKLIRLQLASESRLSFTELSWCRRKKQNQDKSKHSLYYFCDHDFNLMQWFPFCFRMAQFLAKTKGKPFNTMSSWIKTKMHFAKGKLFSKIAQWKNWNTADFLIVKINRNDIINNFVPVLRLWI